LLSSSEQLRKLKTFRRDELTEGVEMECTKPRAICGQGYSWEINFLLWIRKKGGFDPLWRWEKHDAASSSFIPRPDRSRSRNHTYKFVAGDLL